MGAFEHAGRPRDWPPHCGEANPEFVAGYRRAGHPAVLPRPVSRRQPRHTGLQIALLAQVSKPGLSFS
jgi:hypothetical protein